VSIARRILKLSGLPTLQRVRTDAATDAELGRIADRLEAGEARAIEDIPLPRVEFLRWLAEHRPGLFHRSGPGDLEVLRPYPPSPRPTGVGGPPAGFAARHSGWARCIAG